MWRFKRLFGPLTEQIRWSPSDIFSRLAGASNPLLKSKCGLNHYESILFLDSLVKERLGTGNITEFRNVFKLEKIGFA